MCECERRPANGEGEQGVVKEQGHRISPNFNDFSMLLYSHLPSYEIDRFFWKIIIER